MKALRRDYARIHSAALSIAHLPILYRLAHPKSLKRTLAAIIGAAIMLLSSEAAVHAHEIATVVSVPHVIVDTVAYFFHGVGAVPLARYFTFLWLILDAAE